MRQHAPGRATLTQQLAGDSAGTARPAPGHVTRVDQIQPARSPASSLVFQLDRASEDIPAGVGVADPASGGARPTTGGVGATEAPGGTAELRALGVELRGEPTDATVPREGDAAQPPTAHAANTGPHQMAPEGPFNNPQIASNSRTGPRQLERPGVRFDTHKGAVDILFPKRTVHRFLITERGEFVPHDRIHPTTPVAFNLAPLRSRGHATYALSFVNGRGSLWTPLSAFHDTDHLKEEIHGQSVGVLPSDSVGPGTAAYRVFRESSHGDGLARAADLYILPDKSGPANKLDHYRYRSSTQLYNVLLNLPQAAEDGTNEAPSVAVDSAQPGWAFFIARGSQFRRQVPLFAAHSGEPETFVTFVFGFLGQATRQGPQLDLHRRGWVPKGVLRLP
jgi:hypothetical protein